ncbi:XRE family transcriptional regulator [Streptomyces sp. RY43-2]|uniref:XRE family transcriptional regulator n=1 Tax=Streptomyces macrolidinus TaxID=2952607 RepID=A0ABT0ZKY5_9ACTN|nr:XRE family transcriptional regulator [Streptomyces macrolidinus]MCN9244259.1 XRE family transcriptional regulator [Streptomyces macrolidinus]
MPRWRALPEELDPQLREFASQLRRLVDRSGLSVSAVADRTGYSKTSWERYLNGRLLAPKGAIVALAEVTGTNPVHLTTMWELAERAWSRSELRHDRTMEAIRISQARAELGEFGAAPEIDDRGGRTAPPRGATATAGAAGVVPSVPQQPTATEARDAEGSSRTYRGPAGQRRDTGRAPDSPVRTPGTYGPVTADGLPRDGGGPPEQARPKRRLAMFAAGVVGALVVIGVAFALTDGDGRKSESAAKPSPALVSPSPDLPPGVKCGGASCTGKDPEAMGCGGTLARSATSVTVGTTLVEVRYSKTCGAAWARITGAAQGDTVEVSAGATPRQRGSVDVPGKADAYTPMVAVKSPAEAKACVSLRSGRTGCTA